MEISWKWLNLCIGLLFVGLCNGFPTNLEDTNAEHTQLLTGLVAVLLTVCSIVFLAGCLCCQRRNGFKEFRNSTVVASTASNLDHGHVNPIANGEFTIFTPLSPPHFNNNVFLANEQVITRTSDDYIYGDINVSSWFNGPDKDFPRIKLKYIKELGKGWFGKVVEGAAQDLDPGRTWTPVVVRILDAGSNARQRVLFLNDASIYLAPPHPNLLTLKGRNVTAAPLLLLQESCTGGDLKARLRTVGSEENILLWCCQLTSALRHLHEHGYAHLDLAARNCLLTDSLILKLGDYGLGPSKYPEDYYKGGTPLIPVRWRSPESLDCTPTTIQPRKLTLEANVWALGVVMWEICENGAQPYGDFDDDEVISRVLGPQGLRLERPSKPELYTDYIFRLIQMCWNNAESRPKVAQIDMMLSDLLQVHKNTQNPVLNATDDFDSRWESFKPNTIVKTDNYTVSIDMEGDGTNISKPMSPSLNNLHGSLDNLTGAQPMESWLENVASETKDPTYVKGLLEAMKDLDTTLDLENVSTGSEQSFRPDLNLKTNLDFRLGPSLFTTNDRLPDSPNQNDSLTDSMIFKQQGSSESETEEENWRKKVERGAYSEKVRLKSRSVADLMVLTHVDYSESESETPLPSLDYRANRSGRKTNLETTSLNFSSEGNLLNIEDTFQEELKKLRVERRDSLLFVPDNRSQNDSNLSLLQEFNSPTDIKPVNQIFNVFNVTIDKYNPIGVSGSKLSEIINIGDESRSFSRQDSENKSDLGYATLHNSERNSDFGSVDGEHLLEDRNGVIKNEIEDRLKNCELFDKSDVESIKSFDYLEGIQVQEELNEKCAAEKVQDAHFFKRGGIKTEEKHKSEDAKEYKRGDVFKTEELNTDDSKKKKIEDLDSKIVETRKNLPDIIASLDQEPTQGSVDLLKSNSIQTSIINEDKVEVLRKYEEIKKLMELCADFITSEIVHGSDSTLNQNKDTNISLTARNIESEIISSSIESKYISVQNEESPESNQLCSKVSNTIPTLSDIIQNDDELMKYIVTRYDTPDSKIEVVKDNEIISKESHTVPDLCSQDVKNVKSSDNFRELLELDIEKTEPSVINIPIISTKNNVDNRSVSSSSPKEQVFTEHLVSDIKQHFIEGPKILDVVNSKLVNDSSVTLESLSMFEIHKSNLVLQNQLEDDASSEISEDNYNSLVDGILVEFIGKRADQDSYFSAAEETKINFPSNYMQPELGHQETIETKNNVISEKIENTNKEFGAMNDQLIYHMQLKGELQSENNVESEPLQDYKNNKYLGLEIESFLNEERKGSIIDTRPSQQYSTNTFNANSLSDIQYMDGTIDLNKKAIHTDLLVPEDILSSKQAKVSNNVDNSIVNMATTDEVKSYVDQTINKTFVDANRDLNAQNKNVNCHMFDAESNNKLEITTNPNGEQHISEQSLNLPQEYIECNIEESVQPEALDASMNRGKADETPDISGTDEPKPKVAFDLSDSQEEGMPNSLTHSTVFTSTPFGKKQELSLPTQDTYSSLNLFGAPQENEDEVMEFSSNFIPLEPKSPENQNNRLNYSLETWDNFLGKSFDSSRGSNENLFDSFTSEPQSMLYLEDGKQEVSKGEEKDVVATQEQTFVKENENNDTFIKDATFAKSEAKDGTFVKDSTFTKDGTFTVEEENKNSSLTKDGTFVIDKVEESAGSALNENQVGGSWEAGGGWFLHPQSNSDKLSGDIEPLPNTSKGSYVGFGMDDEIMAAIRNELLEKLPHAQGVPHEKVKEDEEWDQTERNEVFLRYNVYNTPLSPIPEESFEGDDEEQVTSGGNTPKLDDSDCEWSDHCEPDDPLPLSSQTNESPLRVPNHIHTQSQSSCCSNDTLFNLEDFTCNNEKESANVIDEYSLEVLKDEVFESDKGDITNEDSGEYKACVDIGDARTLENCKKEENKSYDSDEAIKKRLEEENIDTDLGLSKDISDRTLQAELLDTASESKLENISNDSTEATLQAEPSDAVSESKLESSEVNQTSLSGFLDSERNHTSSVESLLSFVNKQVAPLPSPEDKPWKSLPASLLTYNTIAHNPLLPENRENVPESLDNSLNDNETTDAKCEEGPVVSNVLEYNIPSQTAVNRVPEDVAIPQINIEPHYENTETSAEEVPVYENLIESAVTGAESPVYENICDATDLEEVSNDVIQDAGEQATYQNVDDPSDIINEADYVNIVNLENIENTKHNSEFSLDDKQSHDYVNDFKQHDGLIIDSTMGEDHDIFGVLTDIRFNGPIDSQLMSTSFSESNDVDEQDWDSGSDTRSSSSGEFIWKEGEHEESLKALRAAPHDALDNIKPMQEITEETTDSDVSTSSSDEGDTPEFVPSAWDKYATPTKSALRSPEKSLERSEEKKSKGVWFKKQKYHCVYEYPKEPESPILQSQDLWKPQPDYTAFSGTSGNTDDDFMVSSSSRPFDLNSILCSQFFPGSSNWIENSTPDSGLEDSTPGSTSDPTEFSQNYPCLSSQVLPLRKLAAEMVKKNKEREVNNGPKDVLGGLRHTRNKLKLDLPPSPSAFTSSKTFTMEPLSEPVVIREKPTFSTFGKSRFLVQQVDTPTEDLTHTKNVCFDVLPYKPINIIPIAANEADKNSDVKYEPLKRNFEEPTDFSNKKDNFIKGEASLLDSADEDSGIESSTLERKVNNVGNEQNLRLE